MSKSFKLAQSALRIVERIWSIPSATQEPRSSQLISLPEQPAATKLADSEQRPKDIQDVLAGYAPVPPSHFTAMPPLVEFQAQNKRASPSEKSDSVPPAK